MTHYLLSVHMVDALRFSGRLTEPKDAAVVRASGGTVVTTDGPFAETKEHIGGFYIIEAARPGLCAGLGRQGHRRHQRADRGPTVRARGVTDGPLDDEGPGPRNLGLRLAW